MLSKTGVEEVGVNALPNFLEKNPSHRSRKNQKN